MVNSKIVTEIINDPDFETGIKRVDDYIIDPKYHNKLSKADIEELQYRESSQNKGREMLYEIQQKLKLDHEINNLQNLNRRDFNLAETIITKYISNISDYRIKEGLIRLLSVPFLTKETIYFLFNEFVKTSDQKFQSYKWVIGNAIELNVKDDYVEDLINIVKDNKHGDSRQMFVLGLGKVKETANKEKVTDVLIKLLEDDDVAGHAIEALGKLKAVRAKPYIEKFLNHKKTWWRNAAKNAIKKMDKN